MGSESLALHRQGMDTVGHNIANSQTEGFSRQRVDLKTKIPMDNNRLVIGNGVTSDGISRAHDKYIDKQLNESKQFPSTENTKKRLCYNDIKGLNLVDNYLDEDQIKWIEENISNKYHFEDGFKNIYDLLELDDNDHFISIDEYIDNIQYMRKLDNEEGDNDNV